MATASIKNLIKSLVVRELTSFKVGSYARKFFMVVNYKNKSHAYRACFLNKTDRIKLCHVDL